MKTDTPVSARLRRFDGFPYLMSRVVPALYHIIVIPAHLPMDKYHDLFRRQRDANQLETCLVLDPSTAWCGSHGSPGPPPSGGVIVIDRLQPPEEFDPDPDLRTRRARLARFAAARNPGGYMLGDLTKGGRTASPAEVQALTGRGPDGVPRGLDRCGICCEQRGECLDPRSPAIVLRVHCKCENHNRCAACGDPLAERRLNANYWDERDGQVWHVPGFCGLDHRCPPHRIVDPAPAERGGQ